MEILKQAKGDSGEVIPWNAPVEDVKAEILSRSAKAGYCTREGNPTFGTKIMGPGIGESKISVWPRDENGNLIGD